MTSRKEIAKAANVSEAVVSYVTNNSNYVSEEKRARVMEAIQRLGYEPNYFARGLKTKKSDHISIISFLDMGDILDETIYQIEKIAQKYQYSVSISHVEKISSRHLQFIQSRSDGIIIIADSLSEKDINKLKGKNIPIVLTCINRYSDVPDNLSLIHINPEYGVKQLIDQFALQSCHRITYLTRSSGTKSDNEQNKFSIISKIADYNQIESQIVQLKQTDDQDSDEELDTILRQGNQSDAYIVDSAVMAMQLIGRARELGMNVPQDLKVAGFGNCRIAKYFNPPLTTISFNELKLAELIVNELFKQIDNTKPFSAQIQTEAILRLSTK